MSKRPLRDFFLEWYGIDTVASARTGRLLCAGKPGRRPLAPRAALYSFIFLVLLVGPQAFGGSPSEMGLPTFNQDVRPILSDKCFACHGPDANVRKADLALHLEESAVETGAIVPGKPDESEMVRRILTDDPDDRMPPPESNLSLSERERDVLVQWVRSGAEYQPHWAFIPVQDPPLPTLEHLGPRVQNDVDLFVFKRLEAAGIEPAAPAARTTLIRRATLDLTGLPPTEEETEAFLRDDSPDAFAKVIDRLFQSPAYGERMATDWLDVARYADTFGYQADVETRLWPWRDWVIRAFNANLPYNDFATWQIAGDLLPNATQDQRLASAFNRLHRQTNEGGSINEEYRVEYVSDRVHTFGMAFLGLTMECARCHDHKFDPISQKNYYAMSSFFGNIDESGLYSHFTNAVPSPSMFLYEGDQETRHQALKENIRARGIAFADAKEHAGARFESWLADPGRPTPVTAPVVDWPLDAIVDGKTPDAANPELAVELKLSPELAPGVSGQAMHFSGENSIEAGGVATFERTNPFSLSLWIKAEKHEAKALIAHHSKAETDAGSRGYELWLDGGHPVFSLVHFWPGNAIRIRGVEALPEQEWIHIAATYDGTSQAQGMALYVNGKPAAVEVIRDHLFHTILYGEGNEPNLTLAARFRDSGFKDGLIDGFKVFDRRLSGLELQAEAEQTPLSALVTARVEGNTQEDRDALFAYYLAAVDEPVQQAREALLAAHQEEQALTGSLREIMTMVETPEPRQAYVLARGAYTDRAEPVEPGTPEKILPFADSLPPNRLGLSQWLLDPANPLTARVAVNRYWKLLFGRGLVETQEDFGSQGTAPTHPKLLDHLAYRLMHRGWDLQDLLRYIMLSAVYQQDGAARPELQERDPLNTLLARGPKYRLTAEILRDQALAASGLLVRKIGGPSVKPYQPPGLWEESSSATYTPDTGEGLYRRSMYTFWKRTVPPASMMTFDGVNREVCVARRETTTTPLQALLLLNDPQFVEAARVFAESLLTEDLSTDGALVERMFRRLLTRPPDEREQRILLEAYGEQLDYFKGHPEAARQYIATGEKETSTGPNPVQTAAATAIAQLIMNFEEFQVRQ